MSSGPRSSSSRDDGSALACWYCSRGLSLANVLDEGLLRGRAAERGGPYRLYRCPFCSRSNHCERSTLGRWFSSPPFEPNPLEYLLGRFVARADDFLRAVAWHEENAERRRYFFQRDGDSRYLPGRLGFLSRLWRRWFVTDSARGASTANSAGDRPDASTSEDDRDQERWRRAREDWFREQARRRARGQAREDPRTRSSAQTPLASPYRVLGLEDGAGEVEVRRAFHRMAFRYHPDKVHHLGEEFQQHATERFKELQRAYDDALRRARAGKGE